MLDPGCPAGRAGVRSIFRRKTKEVAGQRVEQINEEPEQGTVSWDDTELSTAPGEESHAASAVAVPTQSAIQADAVSLPDAMPLNVPQASLSSSHILPSFTATQSSPASPSSSTWPASQSAIEASDPLSTAYEEHASTPKAKLAPPVLDDRRSSPASDFDPLAATYEEYNLWQITQQHWVGTQEGVNSGHAEVAVQPDIQDTAAAAASPAGTPNVRKTRSIPKFFKARKAAKAGTQAAGAAQDISAESPTAAHAIAREQAEFSTQQQQQEQAEAGTAAPEGLPLSSKPPKAHRRGLSLLKRRTKSNLGAQLQQGIPTEQQTAHADTSALTTVPHPSLLIESANTLDHAEADAAGVSEQTEATPAASVGTNAQAMFPAKAPLVYLPNTFDSFMAGSHDVSSLPQLSPRRAAGPLQVQLADLHPALMPGARKL